LTFVDDKRVYRRGKTWDFAAGRDLSVAHITTVVEEKFRWSTDQRMTIWYGSGDDTVPLISESEIAELFD
jgi:malate/lactate dehydrogenase